MLCYVGDISNQRKIPGYLNIEQPSLILQPQGKSMFKKI